MFNDESDEKNSASSDDQSSSTSSAQNSAVNEAPLLDRLVSYFVAAKRSLSIMNHVWHANEMVSNGKVTLEDIVTFDAKNKFLKTGIDRQLQTLRGIRRGLEKVDDEGHAEFKVFVMYSSRPRRMLTKSLYIEYPATPRRSRRAHQSGGA